MVLVEIGFALKATAPSLAGNVLQLAKSVLALSLCVKIVGEFLLEFIPVALANIGVVAISSPPELLRLMVSVAQGGVYMIAASDFVGLCEFLKLEKKIIQLINAVGR